MKHYLHVKLLWLSGLILLITGMAGAQVNPAMFSYDQRLIIRSAKILRFIRIISL